MKSQEFWYVGACVYTGGWGGLGGGRGSEKFQFRSSAELYFTKYVNNKNNFFSDCRRCRSRLHATRVEATVTYRAPCVTAARSRYVATTSPRSSRRCAASFVMKTDSSNVINVTVRSRTRDTDARTRGGSRTSQREGCEPLRDGCQPIIWPKIPENCMKLKKIGLRGDPPLRIVHSV